MYFFYTNKGTHGEKLHEVYQNQITNVPGIVEVSQHETGSGYLSVLRHGIRRDLARAVSHRSNGHRSDVVCEPRYGSGPCLH